MNPFVELSKLSMDTPHFRRDIVDCIKEVKGRYKDEGVHAACDSVLMTPHRESAEAWKKGVRVVCNAVINFELG